MVRRCPPLVRCHHVILYDTRVEGGGVLYCVMSYFIIQLGPTRELSTLRSLEV